MANDNDVDILVPISEVKWPLVRDIFLEDWPRAIYIFYAIQNIINWKTKDPSLDLKILCPRGSWEDGTVVITQSNVEYESIIYIFTLKGDSRHLQEIIHKTSLIDWNLGPFIYGIQQKYSVSVKAALDDIGLQSLQYYQSANYWMPKEKALNFEVVSPPEVYIAPLNTEDISIINEAWPHRRNGSEALLKHFIQYNGGLGIYLKSDDTLCSWILKNQIMGLGVLQTLDQHKRKGYAKILIMALSKQMAADGIDVHCCIMKENTSSQKLFINLGFQIIESLMFERVKPFVKKNNKIS